MSTGQLVFSQVQQPHNESFKQVMLVVASDTPSHAVYSRSCSSVDERHSCLNVFPVNLHKSFVSHHVSDRC